MAKIVEESALYFTKSGAKAEKPTKHLGKLTTTLETTTKHKETVEMLMLEYISNFIADNANKLSAKSREMLIEGLSNSSISSTKVVPLKEMLK